MSTATVMNGPSSIMGLSYLTQAQAVAIDEELMGPLGFSIDQLMELAGLSVATAIVEQYPLPKFRRVLVVAGPGNNGGDGLVAARHLTHFGYHVQVLYPKPTDKPLYHMLVTQLKALGLSITQDWQEVKGAGPLSQQFDVVIDAVFGFSFKGTPRQPFDEILQALLPSAQPPAIVSVDIPSGWDVEAGNVGNGIQPDTLVSLTAPKLGVKEFKGNHFLGGRFVPPAISAKYSLQLPDFPGSAQHVRLSGVIQDPSTDAALGQKVADMRISYTRGGIDEKDMAQYQDDPMRAWADWFKVATEQQVCEEPNAISLASVSVSGQPSVRVVLLKGFDQRGFMFYTNYDSRKGRELQESGKAAFSVYWEKLQRQVRVEGVITRLSEAESTEYYHSRPHGSQVGAWVSSQSQTTPGGRKQLEDRNTELMAQYPDDASTNVPKPPHWGGFLIQPTAIEFWQGRPSRLHDRILFQRDTPQATHWSMDRLQP